MSDIRFALRSLVRSRWFTLGAMATFVLGMAVSATVFAAVDRILFRPLPYAAPDELILLRRCAPSGCAGSFPSALAHEAPLRLGSVGEMAVAGLSGNWSLSPESGASPALRLIDISPNLLRVLGVRPQVGRDVAAEDVAAKRIVAFITDDTWRMQFGADPDVLGRQLWSGKTTATIIGVLPRGFVQPGWISTPRWYGLRVAYEGWSAITPQGNINPPIARLRPGATLAQARAEIEALHQALQGSAPTAQQGSPSRIAVDRLEDELFSRFTEYVWLIVGAAALVLLIASVNLAALLLARGRARERDTALAAALGASTPRLMRTALIEALILCGASSAVALSVLWIAEDVLRSLLPPLFRQNFTPASDVRVLAFTAGAAFVCAALAALWPVLATRGTDLVSVLQRGAGSGAAPRAVPGGRLLVGVQAAIGVVLVLSAALGVRSFLKLATEDLGFDSADLHLLWAEPPTRLRGAAALQDYESLLSIVRGFPGVIAAAGGDKVHTAPMTPFRGFKSGSVAGPLFEITDRYFQVLGSRVLVGREFAATEVALRAPVAIVSAEAVRQLWPGRTPNQALSEIVRLDDGPARQVVGVVQDLREQPGEELAPAVFVPLGAAPVRYAALLVRTDPAAPPSLPDWRTRVIAALGERTVGLTPASANLAVLDDPRFRAVMLAVFGGCALLLAASGLFALTSLEVNRRRPEMAIRLTLGATRAELHRHVTLSSIKPVVLGGALGVIVAYWMAQLVQSFLYQTDARDPGTIVLAFTTMVFACGAAAWLPARRAARVDPIATLRAQ